MRRFLLLAALAACGPAKPAADPSETPGWVSALYDQASTRLLSMLDRGMVVSRWNDGRAEHQGDALIWTGIAMAALPCDRGGQLEDAVLSMMDQLGGGLARHWDMLDSVSIDGAIGVYRGAAHRMAACQGSKEKWATHLAAHLANKSLNPNTDTTWPGEFRYVPELALARATGGPDPDPNRLVALAAEIETWALGVQASHAACYRVNLGYQTIKTIEELGVTYPAQRRDNFCGVTRGMRLATVDAWCGRGDFSDFVTSFAYNLWEYRHQRCPSWEDPDGKPSLNTPALDLLEAIKTGYKI